MYRTESTRIAVHTSVRQCFECGEAAPPDTRTCAYCGAAISNWGRTFWGAFALVTLALVGVVAFVLYLDWPH